MTAPASDLVLSILPAPGAADSAELKPLKDKASISPEKHACVWIKKAHAGSIQWVDHCDEQQFYYYCLLKKLKPLWNFAKYMLLIVMLFEKPAACIGSAQNCAHMDTVAYSWPIAVIPLEASACIYIVLYIILFCRLALRRYALGAAYHFHGFRTGVAVIGIIGAFCAFFYTPIYVASFICRPLLFLGFTKSLRATVREVYTAVPRFLDVLASLFICVLLFSAVGMVLFVDTKEGAAQFSSWRIGITRMWILFTTNNSPDVFIPAYTSNRVSFFFFWFYLVFMIYLLMNVLLGKVYDCYKELLKEDLTVFKKHQHICIEKAFASLTEGGNNFITKEMWASFFVEYCDPAIGGVQVEDPKDTDYNRWRANVLLQVFHGIDLENASGLNFEQFETAMGVFLDQEVFIPKRRPQSTYHISTFQGWCHQFWKDGLTLCGMKLQWDVHVVNSAIVVNSLVTMWLAYWFCTGKIRLLIDCPAYWIIFVFSLFYAAILTLQIVADGFERFWYKKSIQHRFDFFNVYTLLIVQLLYQTPLISFTSKDADRAILLLSMARLLRLCQYIKPLHHLFFVVKRLIPTYMSILRLLMIMYFFFYVIGRLCFGGRIYNTNPLLAGSAFALPPYWTMNFNDCCSGLVTLFVMMLVNNFTVISGGYCLVTGTYWASMFFIAFFVCCNLVVLNILIALVLECLSVMTEAVEADDKAGEFGMYGTEQMASGSGERSAMATLKQVLMSDDHEDSQKEKPSSLDQGYGTFRAGPKTKTRTLDDLESTAKAPAPKGMSMDLAVTKIQSVFRGKKGRTEALQKKEETLQTVSPQASLALPTLPEHRSNTPPPRPTSR